MRPREWWQKRQVEYIVTRKACGHLTHVLSSRAATALALAAVGAAGRPVGLSVPLGRPANQRGWANGENGIVAHWTNVACCHRAKGRRSAGCGDELHLEGLGRVDLDDRAEIAQVDTDLLIRLPRPTMPDTPRPR